MSLETIANIGDDPLAALSAMATVRPARPSRGSRWRDASYATRRDMIRYRGLQRVERVDRAMHPGSVVRQECLEKHGLGVTGAARGPGVDRQTPGNPLDARSGISPEMAIRLEKAFGIPARDWSMRQRDREPAGAMQKAGGIDVRHFAGAPDDVQGRS